ncbi:MAG: HD domain-containing protein [Candidatus Caldarchaeum sp.]
MKLVKDPVHGYITISDTERKLVDTSAVQRLRRISQLPLVYLVYPGARHSRFDHSLGCMHLAGEFADHLNLDSHERNLLRASALLHDIGHTPFSHLFEQLLMEKGMSHEDMSMKIVQEDDEVASALESMGLEVKEVVDVLHGKSRLSGLVSGPLDVDRLDFLLRDAYFTGATYGIVDVKRIIRLTHLLEDGPAVDSRGMGVVEELAIARYHSFINIYFHHAARAAQNLLLRAAKMLGDELDFSSMSVQEYLEHDDYTAWCLMKNREKSGPYIKKLEKRTLPKRVFEQKFLGADGPRINYSDTSLLESLIAEKAGTEPAKIYVDYSYAPPLTKYGPGEVRIHPSPETGSWIIQQLSQPLRLVRVYADRDVTDLEKIRKAAYEVISSEME